MLLVRHTCPEENTLVQRSPVDGQVYKFKNEGSFGASWDPGRGSVYRVELFLAVRLGIHRKCGPGSRLLRCTGVAEPCHYAVLPVLP